MAEWMYYILSIMFIPLFILTIVVEIRVNSVYKRYRKVASKSGITVIDCTRKMLDAKGLTNISINAAKGGSLSDNYNPKEKSVNLSKDTMNTSSIAAIAIAAHEVGHAYQHADNSYLPMKIRSSIIPLVQIGNMLSIPLFILGLILLAITTHITTGTVILWIAVGLYFLSTLFYLITLPIELNASKRALNTISENGYLTTDEIPAAKELLNAAAWTYIAGLLTSLFYFLRFLLQVLVITRRD